jgi:DNA repair exonuclease SbcCD nuclease subunit
MTKHIINKIMSETVLFIGDVHIKFNNLKDLDTLEDKMLQMKEISFIVVAGDILDTHEKIHSQLMNRAYKLIKNLRTIAPVYVLVGNHDYINNQQFLTDNHWMNGMKEWDRVHVVDYPLRLEGSSGQVFALVPYVPPGRFVEALNELNGDDQSWKDSTCVFAHQEVKNCKMGCIKSIEGDVWEEGWPMLISGHIHERQNVGDNVLYPGSVLNHAFGSDNQGISKLTFKDNIMNEERVDIGLKKKSIIYEDVTKVEDIPKEKLVVENKLCLSGEPKDIKAFKKTKEYTELRKKGIKVTFKVSANKEKQFGDGDMIKTAVPFSVILNELITNERDHDLEKDFTQIKV